MIVVNVVDTPLSHSDYTALSELLLGVRREIVFVREYEDEIADSVYEAKLSEWKQVLYAICNV